MFVHKICMLNIDEIDGWSRTNKGYIFVLCFIFRPYFLFFRLILLSIGLAWRRLHTSSVEYLRPSKIDRFVHTDGDRETEFLSLSLQYLYRFVL
jgi:hypothetical protein